MPVFILLAGGAAVTVWKVRRFIRQREIRTAVCYTGLMIIGLSVSAAGLTLNSIPSPLLFLIWIYSPLKSLTQLWFG